MIESKKHGTAEELKFIAGIGTFAPGLIYITDVKTLLTKYLNTLRWRTNWDGIDRDKVIAAAVKRLAKLTKDDLII